MAIGGERDLQLGADAIGRGDQDRVPESGGSHVEKPAKSADLDIGAGPRRGADMRFDGIDQLRAGLDVYSRVLVAALVNGFLVCSSWDNNSAMHMHGSPRKYLIPAAL